MQAQISNGLASLIPTHGGRSVKAQRVGNFASRNEWLSLPTLMIFEVVSQPGEVAHQTSIFKSCAKRFSWDGGFVSCCSAFVAPDSQGKTHAHHSSRNQRYRGFNQTTHRHHLATLDRPATAATGHVRPGPQRKLRSSTLPIPAGSCEHTESSLLAYEFYNINPRAYPCLEQGEELQLRLEGDILPTADQCDPFTLSTCDSLLQGLSTQQTLAEGMLDSKLQLLKVLQEMTNTMFRQHTLDLPCTQRNS